MTGRLLAAMARLRVLHPGSTRSPHWQNPRRQQCGGLKGNRNGAYRTGSYTVEAKAERRQVRLLPRGLHDLTGSGEQVARLAVSMPLPLSRNGPNACTSLKTAPTTSLSGALSSGLFDRDKEIWSAGSPLSWSPMSSVIVASVGSTRKEHAPGSEGIFATSSNPDSLDIAAGL